MPSLVANFHFTGGHCAGAMRLYAEAFGAKPLFVLRNADANPADFDMPLTPEQAGRIYHAEMEIFGQRVMMSDALEDGAGGWPPLSLVVVMETAVQVMDAYAVLSEGAEIIHPMTETTYSGAFVSLRDRYGVRWEIMTEK